MRGSSLMYLGRGPPTRGPTVRRHSLAAMRPEELERRLRARLDALGPAPRAELLHVLMLPDFERADRIGEFWSYPESHAPVGQRRGRRRRGGAAPQPLSDRDEP
jgi:hypothetical protein